MDDTLPKDQSTTETAQQAAQATPGVQADSTQAPAPQAAQPTAQPISPDLTSIKAELEGSAAEKATKQVLEKIAGALGLSKKEEEKLPTDPKELAAFIRENAKKGTEEILSQREQAEKEQREAQQRTITEGATRFQTLWKSQYEQLAESGKVPKITNAADKNDPGNIAKVKILTKLSQILKENQAKGIDYVPTLKEVFYEHPDVLTTATTTGADVPISGGGRGMNTATGRTYEQVHSTDIDDLVKAKYQ